MDILACAFHLGYPSHVMHACRIFSVFSAVNQWKMKRVPRCCADKKKAKAILLLHFPSRDFKVSDY